MCDNFDKEIFLLAMLIVRTNFSRILEWAVKQRTMQFFFYFVHFRISDS